MTENQDSILRMAFRFFLKGFCGVAGFGLGVIALGLLFSSLNSKSGSVVSLPVTNSITVLPNADGVRKTLPSAGPVVLQLNIHGVIGVDGLTTAKVRNLLVEADEGELKDRVRALLVSIRSPGGTVTDSEGIYRAILDYKHRHNMPVIAYVDGMAASGGYMIAAAADRIVASDVSLVGSVGVISPPFFNVNDALEKFGVETLTIFAGKHKDDLNPFRPWQPDEGNSFHDIVNSYYTSFVDIVTENRPKLNREKLIAEYGAKVFVAKEASELGYIEGSGYQPSDALKLILADAEITGDDYRVVEMEASHWLSDLFNTKSPLFTGTIQHQLLLGPELEPRLMGQFLYLHRFQTAP